MLDSIALPIQLHRTTGARQRILVVGAGIAGITIAQLLRRAGLDPVLVERMAPGSDAGYMLALMPMADPAIRDLGATDAYRAIAPAFRRYAFHTHTGALRRVDDLGELLSPFGDYRGISRAGLLDVLSHEGCAVAFETTVGSLRETADAVHVEFTTPDGPISAVFDLVIVADGIRSRTRRMMPGGDAVTTVDTRWGGWVTWAERDDEPDRGDELWGAGFFVGLYPVEDRLGVFVGGPAADTEAGRGAFVDRIRRRLPRRDDRIEAALAAVEGDDDAYFWPLDDVRTTAWTTPRTVLLGDAAAGFLPTAGIGAAMALESAWMLSRLLLRAGPERTAEALRAFERVQRPRVEAAQTLSRRLAAVVFRRSRALAIVRDAVVGLTSVRAAFGPILRLLRTAPDPETVPLEPGRSRAH